MIVAIDPGQHPAIALIDDRGKVVQCAIGTDIDVGGILDFDLVVEGQFTGRIRARGKARVSAKSVVSLAFTAGFQAGQWSVLARKTYRLVPKTWKDLLFRGGGELPKEIFCARVKKDLDETEAGLLALALSTSRRAEDILDLLDAIGLGKALHLMPIAQRKKYEVCT